MKVSQISQTNFSAGSIYLKNIDSNKLKCYDAIKKMAEDKNIDIFLSKREDSYYLPTNDMYLIFANMLGGKHSANCELINKKANPDEVSVRLYNLAVDIIEKVEKS